MAIEGYNNSFILKSAEKKQSVKPQATVNQSVNTAVKDTFEKKTNNAGFIKNNLVSAIASGIAIAAIIFLPELIIRKQYNVTSNLLKKLTKYKPLIGNELTSHTQTTLKNGKIRINLENDKGRFKYCETVVMDGAKIKQRIISKKEKMSDGRYMLREMKSYKGDNLTNNEELEKNETKYLVKHFKRIKVRNKEYEINVKTKDRVQTSREICSSTGQPVFKIFNKNKHKENAVFLYSGEKCVGIDRQIVPKDKNKPQYNILTIPREGIFNLRYNFETDGHLYNKSLMQKFIDNF